MNKTILKILYDTCSILIIIMIVSAVLTNQLAIALLGLILLKMSLKDRMERCNGMYKIYK